MRIIRLNWGRSLCDLHDNRRPPCMVVYRIVNVNHEAQVARGDPRVFWQLAMVLDTVRRHVLRRLCRDGAAEDRSMRATVVHVPHGRLGQYLCTAVSCGLLHGRSDRGPLPWCFQPSSGRRERRLRQRGVSSEMGVHFRIRIVFSTHMAIVIFLAR